MSHKDYEGFFMLLKIFPGHQVKVIAFLDNVRRLYGKQIIRNASSTMTNLKKTTSKRFHSVNTNRVNKNLANVYGVTSTTFSKKPRSVETLRTKNKIINQFAGGNGFGFNYYLDNNESTKCKEDINRNITTAKSESRSEIKSYKDDQINDINNEIEKLLNYYMYQLNEKVDDSLDSLDEESCISNIKSLDNLINDKINNKNENKLKVGNISDINMKNNETHPSNSIMDNLSERNYNDEKIIPVDLTSEIISNNNSNAKSNSIKQKNNEEADYDEFQANYEQFDNIEEEIVKPTELKNKNISPIIKQTEEKKSPISKKENEINDEIQQNKSANFSKNDDYSHIRLTKSCEEGYLRQNIDQFDIEYMCRCLGLALMKHLESSQEKLHIMDLINFKENFSFFNSIFNLNIEFFNTFFSLDNQEKISNLDKLDVRELEQKIKQENENKSKVSSNDSNSRVNSKDNLKNPISFMSHMESTKVNTSEAKGSIDDNNKKIEPNEIERDMKIINEYFKPNYGNLDNDRYKNVNPNTKNILAQGLNQINELDSVDYCLNNNLNTVEQKKDKKDFIDLLRQSAVDFIGGAEENNQENLGDGEIKEEDENENENENENDEIFNNEMNVNFDNANNCNLEKVSDLQKEKFYSYNVNQENIDDENVDDYYYKETPINKIPEEITEKDDALFESGQIESNYIIDVTNAEKLKNYLLKTSEIYDDDYDYNLSKISYRRFVPPPDPQQIFEFCANIIFMTKMEKEVIMICLIYIERFIFNTGLLMNYRNWKRLIFTSLVIASKIWDDDSFENNHFAQVFTHLKIGEINLLERTFLELINYKVYVKCSEYFKYFFIIKSIALKYNFDGINIIPISVERMMKLQEHAYIVQKKLRKKYSCNNSAQF